MTPHPVKPSEPEPARRPYHSPKREEAALKTRQAIRAAAETLFLRDGYARTSMKAIAEQAGVSEKTMYLAFSSKATLLRDVIQVAVRGDEAPATLSDRPEWRRLMAGPLDNVYERFAVRNAALMTRTAAIIALAESAADTDPQLAKERDRAHDVTRADLHALAVELEDRGALAPTISAQDAGDILYAIFADVQIYLRLVTECGWSEARYADLIGKTLKATIGVA
jgi:AcrR family transcriptional regulator